MKKVIVIVCSAMIALLFYSCGEKQTVTTDGKETIMTKDEVKKIEREDPSAPGSVIFTKGEFAGMKLFMHHCNKCHPGGEKGKGPSLNDKPLPDFLIHFQVRKGLGDMPEFSPAEISKEQLKEIILFVRLLRDTK